MADALRVAVLGAGGPAGVNALKALAEHDCIAIDANEAHLAWCKPYGRVSTDMAEAFDADVVIPQPDPLVLWAAQNVPYSKMLLPPEGTIWACHNKHSTSLAWYRQNLREQPPVAITAPWPDTLHEARDLFGLPFWLRATNGAGAKGAIKVSSLDQGYHWIRFWESRGSDHDWVAEEFLPGRDFAWSSIWYEGKLVTSFARERLEYIYPHLSPEGLTGTPTVARIVHDPRVNEMAEAAVRAIDREAHGIFSVDLREDILGEPKPTEINAGRGFTTFGLWSLYDFNFLELVVELAVSRIHSVPKQYDALPDGLTLSRHIDCGHTFTREPALV